MKGLLFTYAMTYGGSAVALFDPFVGFLVYFCFAIIKPESMWFWSVEPGNYSRTIALAALVGWMGRGFGGWNLGRGRPIALMLLGFLGWAMLSALFAPDQPTAWRTIEEISKIVLPFVATLTLIDSVRKLKQLAWVLALSQAYVALELNLSYLQGYNRVLDIGFGEMDNNCVSIAMVAGAVLAFFLGLGERSWWSKGLAFMSAAMMVHVPMMAMSRGGILGLIVTAVAAFVLIPKQPRHYFAFAVALAIGLYLAGPSVLQRFNTAFMPAENRDASAQSRLEMWGQCWELMQENPVLGLGPHHFPLVVQQFGWPKGKEAHSLWMQIGAELGFPGLGLLAGFYATTVVLLWRLTRRKDLADPWIADAARTVIAATVGFAVAVSFVSLIGLEIPYYIALLGAGLLKLQDHAEPP
jgi:probable O-glycosylation ligase (exosortase A-associated)